MAQPFRPRLKKLCGSRSRVPRLTLPLDRLLEGERPRQWLGQRDTIDEKVGKIVQDTTVSRPEVPGVTKFADKREAMHTFLEVLERLRLGYIQRQDVLSLRSSAERRIDGGGVRAAWLLGVPAGSRSEALQRRSVSAHRRRRFWRAKRRETPRS